MRLSILTSEAHLPVIGVGVRKDERALTPTRSVGDALESCDCLVA